MNLKSYYANFIILTTKTLINIINVMDKRRINMDKINNIENIPNEFIEPNCESNLQTQLLGKLAGSKNLYVNIDLVKPEAISVKYHSHSLLEEFFIILEGTGKLRLNNRELKVKKGDFFAKPPGRNIAHQFINDSNCILKILDFGIKNENDIVSYPDEDVILVKKSNKAFKIKDELKDWSSEPNNKE